MKTFVEKLLCEHSESNQHLELKTHLKSYDILVVNVRSKTVDK